jgi:predicted ATP-binding protein involved in virulence
MRVKCVAVKGLFNIFDHQIAMNMDDRVTIIHAPNGFGKTAILRMIDGLFNARYFELSAFPFAAFAVELDDGSTLRVERRTGNDEGSEPRRSRSRGPSLVFSYKRETPYIRKAGPDADELPFPVGAIEDIVPDLFQVGEAAWQTSDGEILGLDDVLKRYRHVFPRYLPGGIPEARDEPEWLQEIRNAVNVRFVRSDRLVARPQQYDMRGRRGRPSPKPTVAKYSDELAAAINSTLTRYAELSQSLDRSFPVRLVKQSPSSELSNEEIADRLSEFEARRKRLIQSGLLDQEMDPHFEVPQDIDDTRASVLSVYVRDVEQKLAVFDELANRIDLFTSIISRRFRHKKMVISRESGITFTTDTGQPLDATGLSSGEQHEVVMLYELLFKVRPDSLILVDEPEISLHVAWQEEFLRDLQEMTRLSAFDVLIATHSPQIISDRWDLTVELQDSIELQEAVP